MERFNLIANNGQYVCAVGGGNKILTANRNVAKTWETFELMNLTNNKIAIRSYNGKYVSAFNGGGGKITVDKKIVGLWEMFKMKKKGNNKVSFETQMGYYLAIDVQGKVMAQSKVDGDWSTFTINLWKGYIVGLFAANKKFVCASGGGGGALMCNRNVQKTWETFHLVDVGNGLYHIRCHNGTYVSAENGGGGKVVSNRKKASNYETFTMIDLQGGNVAFQCPDGVHYLSSEGAEFWGINAKKTCIKRTEIFNLIVKDGSISNRRGRGRFGSHMKNMMATRGIPKNSGVKLTQSMIGMNQPQPQPMMGMNQNRFNPSQSVMMSQPQQRMNQNQFNFNPSQSMIINQPTNLSQIKFSQRNYKGKPMMNSRNVNVERKEQRNKFFQPNSRFNPSHSMVNYSQPMMNSNQFQSNNQNFGNKSLTQSFMVNQPMNLNDLKYQMNNSMINTNLVMNQVQPLQNQVINQNQPMQNPYQNQKDSFPMPKLSSFPTTNQNKIKKKNKRESISKLKIENNLSSSMNDVHFYQNYEERVAFLKDHIFALGVQLEECRNSEDTDGAKACEESLELAKVQLSELEKVDKKYDNVVKEDESNDNLEDSIFEDNEEDTIMSMEFDLEKSYEIDRIEMDEVIEFKNKEEEVVGVKQIIENFSKMKEEVKKVENVSKKAEEGSKKIEEEIKKMEEVEKKDEVEEKKKVVEEKNVNDKGKKEEEKKDVLNEEDDEELLMCKICFEKRVTYALVPCGHTLCEDCSNAMDKCPYGCGKFLRTIKIFLS